MTSYQKSVALRTILFFMLQRADGATRLKAIQAFQRTQLALNWPDMTVGAVYEIAAIAGY